MESEVFVPCSCDVCTDPVSLFGMNPLRQCAFCMVNCGRSPAPDRIRAHAVRITQMTHAERDRFIRENALKLGAHVIRKNVDPAILSNAKDLIQSVWNLAKAFRGR